MGDSPSPRPAADSPDQQPRATRAQLRAVVENIDEGLVIADASGAIVTINQRARDMIGYSQEDGPERQYHISEFPRYLRLLGLDGRELESHERPMARVMAGERFSDYELRCRQVRTGREWVASFVGTPVRAADGTVELAVLSARDITQRKQVEHALLEAARQKDAFIAALAHELRNPLAPILSAAELIQRDHAADERLQRLAQIVTRQADHLARIVDDLLDVSRITSGRIVLRREILDLARLVREIAEDHRPGFEAAGVQLVTDTEGSAWVDGDPTRLAQIVENLVSNALKFTDAGGRVEVRMESAEGERIARIVVRDTGIGVDPALRETIWEPFSQGERLPRHGSGGLGLGTALIKGLVELHGGEVVLSSPGAGPGSEFVVTLPQVTEPTHTSTDRPQTPAPRPAGRSVLVIEDNPDVASALVEALRYLDCEARVAVEGSDGLSVAQEWEPSVVLCDIGLPGELDGYQVARSLRASGFSGLLVALTGYGRPEDRDQALAAGFDRHATKPVSIDAIEQLLTSSKVRG